MNFGVIQMRKMILRVVQIFTVIYFAIMFFIGSVARIAWNYNDFMSRDEWPSEIEEEAWSLGIDEFLLVRDFAVDVDGETVRRVEFSHWTDERVAQWMSQSGASEGGRLYGGGQAGNLFAVYSDMRVEYVQSLKEEDSRMALYHLGQGTPSKLEERAGRLDYLGRSIPYHLFGEAGLWLIDKVPIAIVLATIVWTFFDVTLSSSASASFEDRHRK